MLSVSQGTGSPKEHWVYVFLSLQDSNSQGSETHRELCGLLPSGHQISPENEPSKSEDRATLGYTMTDIDTGINILSSSLGIQDPNIITLGAGKASGLLYWKVEGKYSFLCTARQVPLAHWPSQDVGSPQLPVKAGQPRDPSLGHSIQPSPLFYDISVLEECIFIGMFWFRHEN